MNKKQREHEAAEEMKIQIYNEQDGFCAVCGKPLGAVWDVAHRIPNSKPNLNKWGKEIINHRLNLVGTCRGTHQGISCNDASMINPATQPVHANNLVKAIRSYLDDPH